MRLGKKQELFQRKIVEFKTWVFAQGCEIRGGDAFRDHRLHGKPGVKKGYGHKNSCHKLKLAEDLFVFRDNSWLLDPEDLEPFGAKWESLSSEGATCHWGGRFKHKFDGVHFSIGHSGFQ